MSPTARKIASASIVLLLNLALLEVLCFGLYRFNPFDILDARFVTTLFDNFDLVRTPYGWDSYKKDETHGQTRPDGNEKLPICGAAFGDSFTFGAEVEDHDTWAALASRQVGCRIVNYGTGGFGTDQTYIKYKETRPKADFIILGVYEEMLRRNMAASWAFYANRREGTIKPYFIVKDGQLEQVPLPTEKTGKAIKAYHRFDYFYPPFQVSFPYALSLLKILYYRIDKLAFEHHMVLGDTTFENKDVYEKQWLLMEAMRKEVIANGSRMAVLFLASPRQIQDNTILYGALKEAYRAAHPEDCIIDPAPALLADFAAHKQSLKAPEGHFNVRGYGIVADEVVKGLKACNFVESTTSK